MGRYFLRGITTALLVTFITLFTSLVGGVIGLGGLNISQLLDIGLLASCLIGGFRSAKESGQWWMGGAVGAGYVTVGTLLLALFLPIRGWGFIQVLGEGTIIGLVIGAFGAGGVKGVVSGTHQGRRRHAYPKPAYGGDTNDCVSGEFNWDPEEEFKERGDLSTVTLRERAEGNLQRSGGEERDPENASDPEWSWEYEGDKMSSGLLDSNPIPVWEAEQVRDDVIGNEAFARKSSGLIRTGESKMRDIRPWWEE